MKTLAFTDEEIELLCRGVLALQDQEADLDPLIALHQKLAGTAPPSPVAGSRYLAGDARPSLLATRPHTALDLQMEHLRNQISDKIDPGPITVDGQFLRQVLARKEAV